MKLCVLILMYGDYHWLHRRCLDSILPTCDDPVIVWANTVGEETRKYLNSKSNRIKVRWSNQNVPKYKAMDQMLQDDLVKESDYIAWFDDDSFAVEENWLEQAKAHLTEVSPDLAGLTMNSIVRGEDVDFIVNAPWYKGNELVRINDNPIISFVAGGFFLGKTNSMKKLGWPDKRLEHKYGDTMLGAAVHQNGMSMSHFTSGVEINSSPTRGELVN